MSHTTSYRVDSEITPQDRGILFELSKRKLLAKTALFAGGLAAAAAASVAQPESAHARTYDGSDKMYGVFESSRLDLAAEAGFSVVEKDLWVTPGHRSLKELPQSDQDNFRAYTTLARANNQQVILNLWQVGWPVDGQQYAPPNTPHQWRDMCDVGIDAIQTESDDAQAANQTPSIVGIVIGVEPNAKYFWKNQLNSGRVYENWLATCYLRIKQRFPDMQVYGGSLASHADSGGTGPEAFIKQMYQAYKDSGRTGPIMDGFDMHSYENDPPATTHPNTDVITVADGDKLEKDLSGFPTPDGQGMPILWGEIGYESTIPAYQAYRYQGTETSTTFPEDIQGQYYADAIGIISKQRYSIGGFIFHLLDDPSLKRLQSGLEYANPQRKPAGAGGYPDAPKKSLGMVQKAIELAKSSSG
jgi:hypothetical protein